MTLGELIQWAHPGVVTRSVSPLTSAQCATRLAGCVVGRVSVSMDALPVVVPVVYCLDGDDVLFRAPLDGALAKACDGSVIAFEVDDLSTSGATGEGWSVQIVGVGRRLDQREQSRVFGKGWLDVAAVDLAHVVRLPAVRLNGHELRRRPVASAG